MFFKDPIGKMSRKDLEEVIREYKDFSKYTRKELEKELRVLLPDINLKEFSDQELEDLLRANYSFSDYNIKELRQELRRHERFEEWTREELEEEYKELEDLEKSKKLNVIWLIIIVIACLLIGYSYGSMNTKLDYLEQRTEQLQQELNLMDYQNDLLKDRVDTLSDVIDLIIIYITSDDVVPEENPGTSAQII